MLFRRQKDKLENEGRRLGKEVQERRYQQDEDRRHSEEEAILKALEIYRTALHTHQSLIIKSKIGYVFGMSVGVLQRSLEELGETLLSYTSNGFTRHPNRFLKVFGIGAIVSQIHNMSTA